MGGGGSKSSSKSYSGSGQKWATPYAKEAVGQVSGVFNANQPGLQQLTDTAQNTLVPAMVSKFQNSLGGANAAQGYNMDVLGGKFMEGNPYLNDIIGQAREGIFDNVNGNFSLAGRYGSGAHTGVLADSLADMESGLRYQNYTTEMARRDAAANALNSQSTTDAGLALGSLGVGAELPYTGMNSMANSLGALFSGGTESSKSKTSGPGFLGGLLGAAGSIGAAAISKSDRRQKKDIEKVGEYPDGLGIYEWTYKGDADGARYRGVMADEVKELRPQAYVPNWNGSGFDAVNYAAL